MGSVIRLTGPLDEGVLDVLLAGPTAADDVNETVVRQENQAQALDSVVVDLAAVTALDPHAVVSLLAYGRLSRAQRRLPYLRLPESAAVQASPEWLDFVGMAEGVFRLPPSHAPTERGGTATDQTVVKTLDDLHTPVDETMARIRMLLERSLGISPRGAEVYVRELGRVARDALHGRSRGGYLAFRECALPRLPGERFVMIGFAKLDLDTATKDEAATTGVAGEGGLAIDPQVEILTLATMAWNGRASIRKGRMRLNKTPPWFGEDPPNQRCAADFPGMVAFITLPQRTSFRS